MNLLLLLAAPVAALAYAWEALDGYGWNGSGPYNASSPLIPLDGFDISKPWANGQGTPANWTLAQKIRLNSTSGLMYECTYLLEDGAHLDKAVEGWFLSVEYFAGPLRNSTDPIKADCSNLLSPQCIRDWKAVPWNSTQIPPDCPIRNEGGVGIGPNTWNYGSPRSRNVNSWVTIRYDPDTYESVMRRTKLFELSWLYKGQVRDRMIGCFGMEYFQNGTTSLADILGVGEPILKPENPKPADVKLPDPEPTETKTDGKAGSTTDGKSAASAMQMSWVAGLLALGFSL